MNTTSPNTLPFTITIIGGGIGGLVLAAGLLRRSIPVLIYEAASSFSEIGLGLSIGPAAHRCMPLIVPAIREIYDSLITTHADSPGYEAFRETWFEIVWAGESFESGGGNGNGRRRGSDGELLIDLKASPSGQTTVRRADFLEALVRLIPEDCVRFGRRLERLEETPDGVKLGFEDGSEAMADIVIGCDGIRSVVKQFMLPEEFDSCKPMYSGMYGYRAVLDMETMVEAVGERRARVSTMYVGTGAYGISYPIMRAKKVNVGLYVLSEKWEGETWVRPATKEEMLKDLGHMGKGVNSLMNVSYTPVSPLDIWKVRGIRVMLIYVIEIVYDRCLTMGNLRTAPYLHIHPLPNRHPRRRSPRLNTAPRRWRRSSYRRCTHALRTPG
jgi:salicylate hydroxylase